jgi:hypothetical protein
MAVKDDFLERRTDWNAGISCFEVVNGHCCGDFDGEDRVTGLADNET